MKQFNSEVFNILQGASKNEVMIVNRKPTFDNAMIHFRKMMPDNKKYEELVRDLETLKQKLQAEEAKRPKGKCTNIFCINNHDQCERCGEGLEKLVGGLVSVAGNLGGAYLKGMAGGMAK